MFLRTRRPARSLAYLLTKLSPLDIANATRAYLEAQPLDRLVALVHRSVTRMENLERRQLGMILGVRSPEHADTFFDEDAPPPETLVSAFDASGARAPSLFVAFLRQNPRALGTLDGDVLETILGDAAKLGMAYSEDAVPAEELDDEPPETNGFIDAVPLIVFDAIASLARPFVVAWRAVAAIPLIVGAILRWCALPFILVWRGILALPRLVVAFLTWCAQPFIFAARACVTAARATGRAIAAVPRIVTGTLRWCARPFIVAGREFLDGLLTIGRGIAATPRLVASGLRLCARPIVAAVQEFIEGLRIIGLGVAAVPHLVATGLLRCRQPLAIAGQEFVDGLRVIGLGIAAVPTLVAAGLRLCRGPLIIASEEIADGLRAIGLGIAAVPTLVAAALRLCKGPLIIAREEFVDGLRVIALGVAQVPQLVERAAKACELPLGIAADFVITAARATAGIVAGIAQDVSRELRSLAASAKTVRIPKPHVRIPRVTLPKVQLPQVQVPKLQLRVHPYAFVAGAACLLVGALALVVLLTPHQGNRRVAVVPNHAVVAPVTHAVEAAKPIVFHHVAPPSRRVAVAPKSHHARPRHHRRVAPPPVVRVASAPRHPKRRRVVQPIDTTDIPVVARALPSRNATRHASEQESPLVQRARLTVASYLSSLHRRDNRSALVRLGLSPDAATSNLPEAAVLAASDGRFRIVDASPRDSGAAKVDVEIHSAGQQYFGVYTVSENGPAVQITNHTMIPISGPGQVAGP